VAVLRAAVKAGPDDLFITGDPHQRIYDSRVSLRAVGISVTGRSNRLRINYRSTAEILAWSTGVMTGSTIDELSGDGSDSLVGYRSLLHGGQPQASGYPNEQAEVAALAGRVREWIEQGVPSGDIALCSRFNLLLDKVFDQLKADGIPVVRVKDQPRADIEGVRLATMHSMKGLEFRCVAVIGVTSKAVPFEKEITPVDVDRQQHESDMLKERCLLFVACPRAREALTVSWSGTSSPFLLSVVSHS
jgi:superfamily I DNA/RNA helicase